MESVEPQDVFGQVHVFGRADYPTTRGCLVTLLTRTSP